jgi:iron(III) transport system substrate-binding protein
MDRSKATGALLLSGVLIAGVCATTAAQEGNLNVLCTPQEDWCQVMVQKFQEQTGIPTAYVRMSSGESLARIRASADDPEFDVWWGGPADGQIAAGIEGLVEPYISPNAADIAPAQKAADGTWTGVYVGALGFCSNQKILDELGVPVPQSWEDLLNPALKGNVAMAHPASSGTAYTTLYTQVTRLGSEDAALDYMGQLHQNILQYTKSGSAPGEMAGRGEIAVGIIFSHDCIKNIEAGFDDLVVSFPSEGTGYEIGAEALIANAKNPDNAKAWLDWALLPETQEIGATVGSFQLPTNPNAAVSEFSVDLSQVNLVDYDFEAAGAARTELTQRFEDEVAAQPAE